MDVKELITTKPTTTFGGSTVQEAANLMAKENKGLLPVLENEETRKVIGVLSNTDIIDKVIAKELSPKNVFVHEIMIKEPISIKPGATTSDAMFLMRKHNIKRILVIENNQLQGIISANDILNAMIKYKKKLLDLSLEF